MNQQELESLWLRVEEIMSIPDEELWRSSELEWDDSLTNSHLNKNGGLNAVLFNLLADNYHDGPSQCAAPLRDGKDAQAWLQLDAGRQGGAVLALEE